MTPKRPYKRGDKDQMSREWKELVKATLAARKMAYVDLERELGCARGAITKLFRQNTSVWVKPICQHLGLPHPSRMADDEHVQLTLTVAQAELLSAALLRALEFARRPRGSS